MVDQITDLSVSEVSHNPQMKYLIDKKPRQKTHPISWYSLKNPVDYEERGLLLFIMNR